MEKHSEQIFLDAFELYADALFRYCYFKTSDREIATDMVSEVFLKSWEYLHKGERIDTIRPFLYRLANNLVIDWYRKKKSLSLDMLSEDGFDPMDTTADTSRMSEVKEAMKTIQKLDQGDQDLIMWRYVEELSPKEIAAILKEKENTVSVRLHRAMIRLRELLK